MRPSLILALCLAAFPARAEITAPLGSPERSAQILQEARRLAGDMLVSMDQAGGMEDKREAVTARLVEACGAMYQRDPDATMTNKLCFDVFWETGLPD